ncbi:hypothetical protein CL634_06275 [bacterium]|nr:hypothetical protein [bacterium]
MEGDLFKFLNRFFSFSEKANLLRKIEKLEGDIEILKDVVNQQSHLIATIATIQNDIAITVSDHDIFLNPPDDLSQKNLIMMPLGAFDDDDLLN